MNRVLLIVCCFVFLTAFSCTDLRKLVGDAPNPDFCNIFVNYELNEIPEDQKIDDVYLTCLNKKTDEEYIVDGVQVERYFALKINDLIEVVTWMRKIEAILDDAEVGFADPRREILIQLKYLRKRLERDVRVLETRLESNGS